MAVDVTVKGNAIEIGEHRPLFATDLPPILDDPYDVTSDGQRFLVITRAVPSSPAMTVLVNWPELLRGRR